MEIQTTIRDFSLRIKKLGISPETLIRVTISEVRISQNENAKPRRSHFPFLYGEVWNDESGPVDISVNTDDYLYESNKVHGE